MSNGRYTVRCMSWNAQWQIQEMLGVQTPLASSVTGGFVLLTRRNKLEVNLLQVSSK